VNPCATKQTLNHTPSPLKLRLHLNTHFDVMGCLLGVGSMSIQVWLVLMELIFDSIATHQQGS
jgi:hypothetical protein